MQIYATSPPPPLAQSTRLPHHHPQYEHLLPLKGSHSRSRLPVLPPYDNLLLRLTRRLSTPPMPILPLVVPRTHRTPRHQSLSSPVPSPRCVTAHHCNCECFPLRFGGRCCGTVKMDPGGSPLLNMLAVALGLRRSAWLSSRGMCHHGATMQFEICTPTPAASMCPSCERSTGW